MFLIKIIDFKGDLIERKKLGLLKKDAHASLKVSDEN